MKLDSIITGDSAVVLQGFEPDCIDLTVTSPPYDNLRTYNGFVFDFETIANQLFRVTKAGGVVVWVVGDATVNGSETGTSFKQALFFKECGFNLHDTMIYEKIGGGAIGSNLAYWQIFEYMFVFSKGSPISVNRIKDRANKHAGHELQKSIGGRSPKYAKRSVDKYKIDEYGFRNNIWRYHGSAGNDQTEHTAPFPEKLAQDHILSWSNEGDTVLDCFTGSGTTLKMAKMNNRHYIGIEISPEYVSLAERRLLATPVPLFGQGRGLTPLALDGGDSAASQALSQPDFLSTLQGESTPAHRK